MTAEPDSLAACPVAPPPPHATHTHTQVVSKIRPDNFEPKVVNQTKDYLYAEFQSPTFGVSTAPREPAGLLRLAGWGRGGRMGQHGSATRRVVGFFLGLLGWLVWVC